VARFCSQCGYPREADARFCERCGRGFTHPGEGAAGTAVSSSMESTQAAAPPFVNVADPATAQPGGWQPSPTPPPVAAPAQVWGAPAGSTGPAPQGWSPGQATAQGWGVPAAPSPVAPPTDQVSASIAGHLAGGRLAPLLALLTGGILLAVATVTPWLTATGGGSASAFDIDTVFGGPHAMLLVLCGVVVVAVAVARLLAATLPPGLELIAAAAGLVAIIIAAIRYLDVQGIPGASLGIGYFAEWAGAIISIVAGVYPTYRAAAIRTRH
jgi:hypothetical protein